MSGTPLAKEHATAEQFRSESNTDLDIERLPSGKVDTHDLVLAHATLAYNFRSYVDLSGSFGTDAPVRYQSVSTEVAQEVGRGLAWLVRCVRCGRGAKNTSTFRLLEAVNLVG
jgi:hypothetical protein